MFIVLKSKQGCQSFHKPTKYEHISMYKQKHLKQLQTFTVGAEGGREQ